jgi:hypothetical protein
VITLHNYTPCKIQLQYHNQPGTRLPGFSCLVACFLECIHRYKICLQAAPGRRPAGVHMVRQQQQTGLRLAHLSPSSSNLMRRPGQATAIAFCASKLRMNSGSTPWCVLGGACRQGRSAAHMPTAHFTSRIHAV